MNSLAPFFKFPQLVLVTLLLSSACAIPQPTFSGLRDGFQAVSYSIDVKKPSLIYRDKHYNVNLGTYSVTNSKIDQYKDTGEKYSVSKEKIDKTLDNLILENKLQLESAVSETFAKSSKARFSFDIAFEPHNVFQSKCELIKISYLVEEHSGSRLSFSGAEKKPNKGRRYEQWQQTNTACNLTTSTDNWTLSIVAIKDKKPIISLSTENKRYELIPIFLTRVPGTFDFRVIQDEPDGELNNSRTQESIGTLFGYSFRNNVEKVASTSFAQPNGSTIRIRNGIDEAEAQFLIGASQTLNMIEWLDERD